MKEATIMGKNQGKIRLENGIKRSLCLSEINRKYIYITKDINSELVIKNSFDLFINGEKYGQKTLDKSGRLLGLSDMIIKIGHKQIEIKIINKNLYINY